MVEKIFPAFRWGNSFGGRGMVLSVFIILISFSLVSCQRQGEPFRLGFVGSLTGPYSDLGIAGRDGATLAVEDANQAGGINGRRLVLITKDDKNDPVASYEVDKELIGQGVVAIIGHMTSEMSMNVLGLVNEHKVPMISPTASSAFLSGKDDWFLRVGGTLLEASEGLADEAIKRGLRKVSVIYSGENRAFADSYLHTFKERLVSKGGELVQAVSFTKADYGTMDMPSMEVLAKETDAVLIIASATETAYICQQINKLNPNMPRLGTGWALTQDLIIHGGRAVDGIIIAEYHDPFLDTKEMLDFKEKYKKRFGREPTFAARYSYEAVNVVVSALRKNPDPKSLKSTILEMRRFRGPSGEFEIDQFGDTKRPLYVVTVSNQKFVVLDR